MLTKLIAAWRDETNNDFLSEMEDRVVREAQTPAELTVALAIVVGRGDQEAIEDVARRMIAAAGLTDGEATLAGRYFR